MNIKKSYAAVMTSDIEAARKWYESALGAKHDAHPMSSLYEWNFPDGGGLQLFEDAERAGFSSVTFFVTDIVDLQKELSSAGIETEEINEGEAVKTMIVYDPENNRLAFAESTLLP